MSREPVKTIIFTTSPPSICRSFKSKNAEHPVQGIETVVENVEEYPYVVLSPIRVEEVDNGVFIIGWACSFATQCIAKCRYAKGFGNRPRRQY